ncbi:MAG: sporulation integral membrane protein YtvI, partial [Epulopiscium sp. Nele67-Bin004]
WFAYDMVSGVPSTIFFVIITCISTFFMTKDYHWLVAFMYAQLPKEARHKIKTVNRSLKSALGGYVKTQLILMCFTFSICAVGLFILNRDYALLISLGIAVFDAFPMLGSGAILITWGVCHLILGNYGLGIGLLAIYGTILVTRQILEPRVLAEQLGIYALVTIISIYVGLKVMGAIGIIVGPMIAVTIQTLQKVDVIPKFKEVKRDDYK